MDQPFHEPSQDIVPFVKGLSLDTRLSRTEATEQFSTAISPFMVLSSELDNAVTEGIRKLDGWKLGSIIFGSSSDISTAIETVDGGILRMVLTMREVPEGLSEEEIVAYVLKHGNSGTIAYFAPETVNEARRANPSKDAEALIDDCESSAWGQIGLGFNEHLFHGDPSAALIEYAQAIYADRQIEAFTHFNEVRMMGRAAFEDGDINAIYDYVRSALELYEDALERMIRGDFELLESLISREEIEAILAKIKLKEWTAHIKSSRRKLEDKTLELIDRINQSAANFKSYGDAMHQIKHRLEMYIEVDHKTYENVWNEGVVEVLNRVTSLDEFGNLIGLEGTYKSPRMAPSLGVAVSRAALLYYTARQPQIILPPEDKPEIDK